jgi:DNA-binding NarL/FixJ family response regulator
MTEPVRVLIADDHPLVRDGLRAMFASVSDVALLGEAADGEEAVEQALAQKPEVVVMDLHMPGTNGVEATRRIVQASPEIGVLVLTMAEDDDSVFAAMRAGARGYLLKGAGQDEILRAIRSVAAGDAVFGPDAVRRLRQFLVGDRRRPEGTVTFVFTDVEGSTAIVDRLGDERARTVLRAHDAIVREVVAEHDGLEVEHEGDSFMLAFSSARRAIACALAIQRALADQPVRVRIGVNTGDVIAEEERYFGRAVFFASRVMSRADGAQTLVSEVTKGLLGDSADLRFDERGEHSLKGFPGVHRLYEVRSQA